MPDDPDTYTRPSRELPWYPHEGRRILGGTLRRPKNLSAQNRAPESIPSASLRRKLSTFLKHRGDTIPDDPLAVVSLHQIARCEVPCPPLSAVLPPRGNSSSPRLAALQDQFVEGDNDDIRAIVVVMGDMKSVF